MADFRSSMNWLHTWAGVTVGFVLFAVFWMGTLAVFDEEIDRWMMPPTRLAAIGSPPSLDAVWKAERLPSDAGVWRMALPTERNPTVRIRFQDGQGRQHQRVIDPVSGSEVAAAETLAGTGFIYPFHVHLHLRFYQIGEFLVGAAGMAMLVLIVSGVIIHRKIFTDFFSLRIHKKERRVLLDLHNVSGVLALPFHFVITLSGLVIFLSIYFPGIQQAVYGGNDRAYFAEAYGTRSYARPKENRPAAAASLDGIAATARGIWNGDAIASVEIFHPGDAASYVLMIRSNEFRVGRGRDRIYFDAATGAVLHNFTAPAAPRVREFIGGLHAIEFKHWTLRWLYFVLGLTGCVLIATGFLFWAESRRKKHAQLGHPGTRVVECLTVGAVSGIVIATLAFFVANRLLPAGASFAGFGRAALEVWAFYLVWLAAFGHAWLRPQSAWVEQCWAIAALALLAVFLNAVTTGDHLLRSLAHRHLWSVAGMDLMLLLGAGVAAASARKLARTRRKTMPVRAH